MNFFAPYFQRNLIHLKPSKRFGLVFALLFPLTFEVLVAQDTAIPAKPTTFCNPLSIPNYPVSKLVRDIRNGEPIDDSPAWCLDRKEQFRELADPSVIYHEGKWVLYPSEDMAWVSSDNGGTWQHHPLNIREIGWAPTVVKHQGRFLLMASKSALYESKSPLGPFEKIGSIPTASELGVPEFIDPMLFSDDDGRLYFYWGCTATGGIWGLELDADSPARPLSKPQELISFRPDRHPWEAWGEWNQVPNAGWLEGAWMIKRNGQYYLTYSCGGTENRTYAMGCYSGTGPLGPFTPQKRNPIFRTVDGLNTGTAHGCIVAGPDDRLWSFYTIRVGVVHGFERRPGMDRVEIDSDEEIYIPSASSLPQWLPGQPGDNHDSNATGWLPINGVTQTIGSSQAANSPGRFAVDNDMRTWWAPATDDKLPMLTSRFFSQSTIHAFRIIWRDVEMDTQRGILPGPIRYRVELETEKGKWTTVLDRSKSTDDLLIDYRECSPTAGTRARLVILEWPRGIVPAVCEFTAFGQNIVK
jgi:xylan 1,4-beta-xylosidase